MEIGNLRPVTLKDGREGQFHDWQFTSYLVARNVVTKEGGQVSYTQGIVELNTGEVILAKPEDITFNDTDQLCIPDEYENEEGEQLCRCRI